jgi:hypothetical protein
MRQAHKKAPAGGAGTCRGQPAETGLRHSNRPIGNRQQFDDAKSTAISACPDGATNIATITSSVRRPMAPIKFCFGQMEQATVSSVIVAWIAT